MDEQVLDLYVTDIYNLVYDIRLTSDLEIKQMH